MPSLASQCTSPILLRRSARSLSTNTKTETFIDVACGTRLAEKCESCSQVYSRDAMAVMRSGLVDGNGKQVLVTFITVTAPGADVFGATHQRRTGERKDGKKFVYKCACGLRHSETDSRIGVPVDPTNYDYIAATKFNAASSRLLALTFQKLANVLGVDRVERVRVAEFQARGLVHFHCLVRGIVTSEEMSCVILGGVSPRTGEQISPVSHDGITWGSQFDVKPILPGSKNGLGFYLLKLVRYAAKSAGTGVEAGSKHGDRMAQAALMSCECEEGIYCDCGSKVNSDSERVRLQRTYETRCRKHRNAARGWGFRGHVFTTSRGWGRTFKLVREQRRDFCLPIVDCC
jgi:hypothetical protein